jgi:hypothetical protein
VLLAALSSRLCSAPDRTVYYVINIIQVLLAALSSRLCSAPDRAVKAASAATLSAILAAAEQHAGGAGNKLSKEL